MSGTNVISRSSRKMFAYAGGYESFEASLTTAADHDVAGLVFIPDTGTWRIAAHGWSAASVRKRAMTAGRSWTGGIPQVTVANLYCETAPMIRKYFGSHQVYVTQVFFAGEGWRDLKGFGKAGKQHLRYWAAEGAISVMVQGMGRAGTAVAEFQMSEIIRDCRFRLPHPLAV